MSYCVVIQAVNDELLRENSDSIGSDVNDTNDSVLVWYMVVYGAVYGMYMVVCGMYMVRQR